MKAVPTSNGHLPNSRSPTGTTTLTSSYVRRLSPRDTVCERQPDGNRCLLDTLAQAEGVRLPEGIVLGEEAHLEFMTQSGLLEELHARPKEDEGTDSRVVWLRHVHRSSPIEGELNREICAALVELGASSVAVISGGGFARRGLKSIPEVKDAVRDAWLSSEGLRRQVKAASRGEELPSWSVMILAEAD
jgi:hypothetical protein